MFHLDNLEILFAVWAFFFQIAHIVHFALRKRFFESYTIKIGWIVYALSIPAVVISIVLLLGGKTWSFWLGGFLYEKDKAMADNILPSLPSVSPDQHSTPGQRTESECACLQ